MQDPILQLNTEVDRLQSIQNLLTDFFGSTDWLSPASSADQTTEQAWLQEFFQLSTDANGDPQLLDSAAQNQLMALPLPTSVSTADATDLIDRWNNTITYNSAGIVNAADVPAGQSTNFTARDVVQ